MGYVYDRSLSDQGQSNESGDHMPKLNYNRYRTPSHEMPEPIFHLRTYENDDSDISTTEEEIRREKDPIFTFRYEDFEENTPEQLERKFNCSMQIISHKLDLLQKRKRIRESILTQEKESISVEFLLQGNFIFNAISCLSYKNAFMNNVEKKINRKVASYFWKCFWYNTKIPSWIDICNGISQQMQEDESLMDSLSGGTSFGSISSEDHYKMPNRWKGMRRIRRRSRWNCVQRKQRKQRGKKKRGVGNFPTRNKLKLKKNRQTLESIMAGDKYRHHTEECISHWDDPWNDICCVVTHDANKIEKNHIWIGDTGASTHMSNTWEGFTEVKASNGK